MTGNHQEHGMPRSRRAILAGALAGIGAAVGKAVVAPMAARAAGDDGAVIHVGDLYANAQSQTTLANQANNGRVLWVASNADLGFGNGVAITAFSAKTWGIEGISTSGGGILGRSTDNAGVVGRSQNGIGVIGDSLSDLGVVGTSLSPSDPAAVGWHRSQQTGLMGFSADLLQPLPPVRAKTGVYGHSALGSDSRGVIGQSPSGQGVRGESTSGVGVFGTSTTGFALHTSGRLRIQKVSGVATIARGSKTRTVTPGVKVTTTSFVLLTPKANLGARALWFTTNTTANTLTIHMSSARSSATKIAWLLVN